MNQKTIAVIFEISALVIGIVLGYYLGCYLGYGIWAVEIVYLGTVAFLFM